MIFKTGTLNSPYESSSYRIVMALGFDIIRVKKSVLL